MLWMASGPHGQNGPHVVEPVEPVWKVARDTVKILRK